jgi:hypothetical protein
MARRKLISEPSSFPDLSIIGINSLLKDYRLAFFLNKDTALSLNRMNDLPVYAEKENLLPEYPLYYCHQSSQRAHFYLLGNNHAVTKIIPVYKQADFLLMVRGQLEPQNIVSLAQNIRKINGVQLVFNIDLSKVKNLEGIMSDIELHMMSN